MTDPKTRALELVDELEAVFSWVMHLKANRTVVDGHKMSLGRWYLQGIGIVDESEVLAWKPADSTELPEGFGR